MNKENAFLPHFIDEEIYIIDKPNLAKEPVAKPVVVEPAEIYETTKIEKEKTEVEVKSAPTITYEGQNNKGILLLVNSIFTEEKAFLEKVLGAVKLTMDDCALLSLSDNNTDQHHQLIEKFESKIIISFGSQNLNFLQNINNYKINFVSDKKALQVDDLKTIMSDVSKKKQLWECLQQLFL